MLVNVGIANVEPAGVAMDQETIWPSGLRVLVIDDNSSYLSVMEELLLKCGYKVTMYNNVREAMCFICGNLHTVDLIISDAFFPAEDGLLILQEVTSKFDIPTVKSSEQYALMELLISLSYSTVMSSIGDTDTVMKYITNGASDFLIKPVRIEELKNIWQHVFRKKIGEEQRNNAQHVVNQLFYPPNEAPSPCQARTIGFAEAAMALESEVREGNGTVTDVRDLRKARLSWTVQLHRQFITAVNFLGAEKAVPKKIWEVMNVKHLTREQVASHLQKYRLRMRKSTQTLRKDDGASSSSHPHA
ncbi:hypothetical protein EJB05_22066, partial [Eragrostis curvula]